jgi:predicted esterase
VSTYDNVNLVEAPVIIQHATGDESVPYEWGVNLFKKFNESKKEVHFYTYQGDNHDIAGNWGTALARDVELFRNTK